MSRLLWALLAVPLPIFFAGLMFSVKFRATVSPAALEGEEPQRVGGIVCPPDDLRKSRSRPLHRIEDVIELGGNAVDVVRGNDDSLGIESENLGPTLATKLHVDELESRLQGAV